MAPDDTRALSVTGGLPYHGGPGSGYMTHSIAQMARELRADPGSLGMVSGVGMTMTKHVFGVYSTDPGTGPSAAPDANALQQALDDGPQGGDRGDVGRRGEVAGYSVVHGRDGEPEWALLVCDVGPTAATYARSTEPELLRRAESEELVGRRVRLDSVAVDLMTGPGRRNDAALVD